MIEVVRGKSGTLIEVYGTIDGYSSGRLIDKCRSYSRGNPHGVTVKLNGVTYEHPDRMMQLRRAMNDIVAQGGRLSLIDSDPDLAASDRITGQDKIGQHPGAEGKVSHNGFLTGLKKFRLSLF